MSAAMADSLLNRAKNMAGRIWLGIREWCGDAAYERYLKSHARQACSGVTALNREQFYLEQLHKRYSRVSRCC